jgi:hypothetical protein
MAKSVQPFWAFVWHFQIHLTFSFFISNLLDLTSSSKLFLTYYPSSLSYTLFFLWFHPSMQVGSFWTNNKRYIKGLLKVWKWNGNEKGSKGARGLLPLVLNAFPNHWEYIHICILLVVKCIPKFNFVCFAMSYFDRNHDKEKKFETFRHFA